MTRKKDSVNIGGEAINNVFKSLDIGIAIHKPVDNGKDFLLIELNKKAQKIDKIKRKDVLGKRLTENFPAVKKMGILDIFSEVYRTGKPKKLPAVNYKDDRISGYRETSIYKEPSGNIVVVYEDVTDIIKKEKRLESQRDYAEEELQERLKELNCLYKVYEITSKPNISLDEIFTEVLKVMPASFYEPDTTFIRFIYDGKTYNNSKFKPTKYTISEDMELFSEKKGKLEVFYKTGDNPHIEHEKKLIKGIARIVMEKIQRRMMIDILRTSEDKYRMIVENQTDIILVTDTDTNYTYVSPSYCKLVGKSEEELIGRNAMDFVFEDDIESTEEQVKKLYSPPYENKITQRVKTKKGLRWYEITVRSRLDEDNKVKDFIAIGRDVDDRKRFEEELNAKHNQLRTLIDNIPDSIFIKDKASRFMLNNRAHIKLMGAKGFKEPLGKTDFDYFPDYLSESAAEDEKKVLSTGKPMISKEEMIIDKDSGKKRYFITSKIPLKDDDKKVVGLIGIARDVTELKEYSEKLKASNMELQQFAYVASHDLQEPLRVLSGFTQLLSDEYKDDLKGEAVEYMDYILDATDRMKDLINDLLDYSRVGTRGKPFESVDVKDVIDEAVSNLGKQIEENNASVKYKDMPELYADRRQLVQLFQNLISNAIKFKGKKDPKIDIQAKKNKNTYHFTVKDNGIGIEKQFKERIFQVFERLHTREKYEGTGIGLAICKKIVERHNGKMWVVSIPDKGSKFNFTINTKEGEESGR